MKSPTVRVFLLLAFVPAAVAQPKPAGHGARPKSLVVRNAMVIEGNGAPATGPRDIYIDGGTIAQVLPAGLRRQGAAAEAEIDAKGKYVLPGFVNLHAHVQDERAGVAQDVSYCLKLWLACGVTTIRDVGSNTKKTLALREQSAKGEIAAPRIFIYAMAGGRDPSQVRERVREIKAMGADGIKIMGLYRDVMEPLLDEAHRQNLPVAHHAGVEETNAWDDIRYRTTSIEHWYGIPDAALDGVQNFPPSYNYSDEVDRFRYAGHLWRQANWEKVLKVLDGMIAAGVAWDPTLGIYEANRDLLRAKSQPWFAGYLHPALAKFFEPSHQSHGSYFFNWTTEDEIYWKENFRIWMRAVREFGRRGGLIGMGEDAGYIYQMYGFSYLRNLELHQEAGFHPLEVIRHATSNGARILKQESRIGRVRAGWAADLVVVNGNPQENFKILNPTWTGGGIEWTIKDGIPYHAPTLMNDVKEIVAKARAK